MNGGTGAKRAISVHALDQSAEIDGKFLQVAPSAAAAISSTTLKSLINEQGGYVVFLVLSEYLFISDFRVNPSRTFFGG